MSLNTDPLVTSLGQVQLRVPRSKGTMLGGVLTDDNQPASSYVLA